MDKLRELYKNELKATLEQREKEKIKEVEKEINEKKYKPLPLLLELIKWKAIDVYRELKEPKKPHLYSIKLIVGLYGMGKTIALTRYLEDMRNKYGNDIYIATNYFYSGQDFSINHWKDLTKTYDKPVIFGYDEIQNDFNSRDYQNFPVELLTLLTQNRKGNGKQIIGTAQRFNRVDKIFRELSQEVWSCHTLFGRLTSVKIYDVEDYEMLLANTDVRKRMRIRPKKRWKFVQTDHLREQYDSFQTLESATSKEYISKTERYQQLI